MCGGNLYNIMLRQELNKKNQVNLKNEQAKINKIAKEHSLIKSIRKFGHMFRHNMFNRILTINMLNELK